MLPPKRGPVKHACIIAPDDGGGRSETAGTPAPAAARLHPRRPGRRGRGRLPRLHAGGDLGHVRAPGRRPLSGVSVRTCAGRGPPLPVQRRRAALDRRHQPPLHRGARPARSDRDPRRRSHRLRHRDGRRLLRGIRAACLLRRHAPRRAARGPAGRAARRLRRARRVVVPLRLRYRALPVPGPVAAGAGWPARMRACRSGRFRRAGSASRRRDCPSPSPWPWPGRCARARPPRFDPALAAGGAGWPSWPYRVVTGPGWHVRRGQVPAQATGQPGPGHRARCTSTSCAACCWASIHHRSHRAGAAGLALLSPLALTFHRRGAIVPPRALRRATAAWLAMVAAVRAGHAQRLPRRPVPALRALGLPGLLALRRRARARDDLGHPRSTTNRPLSGPAIRRSRWGRWPPCASRRCTASSPGTSTAATWARPTGSGATCLRARPWRTWPRASST